MAGDGFEVEGSGRAVVASEATKILQNINVGWIGGLTKNSQLMSEERCS
jgi:hypothetical protein